ncbi:LAMI_0G11012g1_1 [Lachancea mirantina]|uniref:LAMI_0G11012g1_1 n=1 Tax=Lachancea mirantina TaxID=1230905 RepID=A0A1G4KAU7_9SACH|nr:LAMI_0G11012g1_1 [Lachancea mirantina]
MTNKTVLPPINSLLVESEATRSYSEPCSPYLVPGKLNSFRTDQQGVIKLPPVSLPTVPAIMAIKSLEMAPTGYPAGFDHISANATPGSTPRGDLKRANSCNASFEMSPSVARKTPYISNMFHSSLAEKSRILPATPCSASKQFSKDSKRAFAFISHSQDTFPGKEPSIDNAPLARRKRRRTSKNELNILQAEFLICATPDKQKRVELSERCNMSEKAIQIWFQNRRQSVKRQQKASLTENSAETTNSAALNPLTPVTVKPSSCTSKSGSESPTTPPSAIDVAFQRGNSNATERPEMTISTPTKDKTSPTSTRGQALTFRLKSDTKILTPIRTSPNNRVNKLINGRVMPRGGSKDLDKIPPPAKLQFKPFQKHERAILKEIDINTLRA